METYFDRESKREKRIKRVSPCHKPQEKFDPRGLPSAFWPWEQTSSHWGNHLHKKKEQCEKRAVFTPWPASRERDDGSARLATFRDLDEKEGTRNGNGKSALQKQGKKKKTEDISVARF